VDVRNTCFANLSRDVRDEQVRTDAGFDFDPVLVALQARPARYAAVAHLTRAFKHLLPGLSHRSVNRNWEMAEFENSTQGWRKARCFVVAGRFNEEGKAATTLFAMGRYIYRAPVTKLPLTPAGIWHFSDGRSGMERRIGELRVDLAIHKTPTVSSPPALYREIARLA
jgi:hypothetical protein